MLARPHVMIDQRAAEVAALRDRAGRCLAHRLDAGRRATCTTPLARLRALSPAATLERGYAIVQRADGHVVRAAAEVARATRCAYASPTAS